MRNKLYIVVFLLMFIVPHIVLASWWNPFSWFERNSANFIQETNNNIDNVDDNNFDNSGKLLETEEVIKEKIIEKTIVVDNPELQKQINTLFQENASLKEKVNSLSSSLDICKANKTNEFNNENLNNEFSDFNFSYILNTNKITFPFNTSRDIVIKKAVFNIKESTVNDTRKVGSIQRLEVINSTGSKPILYNLENTTGSTFVYMGTGIPLRGKEVMYINVTVANSGGKESETFYMIPDFSKWEIWDNTTDKQVIIN